VGFVGILLVSTTGLILAPFLCGLPLTLPHARQGFAVQVYERRPDMRRQAVGAGRSINLAVSTRGLHALGQREQHDGRM
jgi:kynurenine 3-monooxygenase